MHDRIIKARKCWTTTPVFGLLTAFLLFFLHDGIPVSVDADRVQRIEMHLSAFGVESDRFPSINVVVDFTKDSSFCDKSYYNPAFKSSTYGLTPAEMKRVAWLLEGADLAVLKKEYSNGRTDQPTSYTTIYCGQKTYRFKDYGLAAPYPLKDIYDIVYKY